MQVCVDGQRRIGNCLPGQMFPSVSVQTEIQDRFGSQAADLSFRRALGGPLNYLQGFSGELP